MADIPVQNQITPYLVNYKPNGDRVNMAKVPPDGTLLDTPCVLNMGALQLEDQSAARKEAQRAAKTFFRIAGASGTSGEFRTYAVIYNISENKSKSMARHNMHYLPSEDKEMPCSPMPAEFAKKYIIGDINPPLSENPFDWWCKRFSRLIVISFSMGSVIGCEMLNKCNELLQQKGFSLKEATQILSHVKYISGADVSDVTFFKSGASAYRTLNKKDTNIPLYSDNLETCRDWKERALKEHKLHEGIKGSSHEDALILTSMNHPNQHLIYVDRGRMAKAD